jgi:predicted dehydrogenase
MPVRLGIIGLGQQVRNEYVAKHLAARVQDPADVIVEWVSGYRVDDEKYVSEMQGKLGRDCQFRPEGEWKQLLIDKPVDAVLVSLPNEKHLEPLEVALTHGVHAVVDKPTVVRPDDCARLVKLAHTNKLVFMTLSQRRYEDVYRTVRKLFQNGSLGEPRLIEALMAHEYFGGRNADRWEYRKSLSGGGALIASGYHLIDTILWLLRKLPRPVKPVTVSARWVIDTNPSIPDCDHVETTASVNIGLSNGGIFHVTASYDAAPGALDENIKIYGSGGTIRIMRDRFRRTDQKAAALSFQDQDVAVAQYDTSEWGGLRWKPLEEFLAAVRRVQEDGSPPDVLSSAADSLPTLPVIDLAYQSAQQNGIPLPLAIEKYHDA